MNNNHSKMKPIIGIILTFITVCFLSSCTQKELTDFRLIPYPQKVILNNETVDFTKGLDITNGEYSTYINRQLIKENIPINKGIKILFETSQLETLGDEGYQLISKGNTITILSNTKAGSFYGVQTLLQLAAQGKTRGFDITDKPQFKWRAYMLDEARYFQGKETVKSILDEMAKLKMNVFHWHLTDDAGWRVEIKGYPLLTEVGSKRASSQTNDNGKKWDSETFDGVAHEGFYTQEDIKEIVSYAQQLNITIMPEISMPGHASAAVASYPWLGTLSKPIEVPVKFGVVKTVYNPASEQTINFIQNVLKEVSTLFPGNTIHIGGDEAKYDQWKNNEQITNYMKAYNLETYSDVQVKFTNDISGYIETSLGKRAMGWNEILGQQIHDWATEQVNAKTQLSKDAIIQFWRGKPEDLRKAIDAGHQLVNSTHSFTYLDYTYEDISLEKAYSFNPIPEGFSKKEAKQVLGLGTQMWGEWTPTKSEVYSQTFPRIAAYAETGWTNTENKDYDRFISILPHIIKRWENSGLNIGEYK